VRQLAINKTVYKVNDFLSWQRGKTLVLSPSFQRRPVWKPSAKSYLLDTVVRGLPVPIIFIRERTNLETLEPIREVVDGQQRLRSLLSFIEPGSLKDFKPAQDEFTISRSHNRELASRTFQDMPTTVRKAILNYEFSVQILPADTDDREVLQIFARLNSTGVKLKAQEIRNAEFVGPFKQTMYALAYEQLGRWRDWYIFTENEIARMDEVELTSDLVYMMFNGLTGMTQANISALYKKNEIEFPEEEFVQERFRAVMEAIDISVGGMIPGSPYSRRVLFHTLFTLFYDLLYGLKDDLAPAKARAVPPAIRGCLNAAGIKLGSADLPDELAKSLRGATNDRATRLSRLNYLRESCGFAKTK
jgi:hypothetical protein